MKFYRNFLIHKSWGQRASAGHLKFQQKVGKGKGGMDKIYRTLVQRRLEEHRNGPIRVTASPGVRIKLNKNRKLIKV